MLTGLHVTSEEVDAWVDRLLKGEKAELPECHA
jgi:predicted transcriptional regulator